MSFISKTAAALRNTVAAFSFLTAAVFGTVTTASAQAKPARGSTYEAYEGVKANAVKQQKKFNPADTIDVASLNPYGMEENEVYNLKSIRIQYDNDNGTIMGMDIQAWKDLETDEPNNGITNLNMHVSASKRNAKIGNIKNNTAVEFNSFDYKRSKYNLPQAAMQFTLKETAYSNDKDAVAFIAAPIPNKSHPDVVGQAQLIKTMTFISNGDALVTFVDKYGREFANPQFAASGWIGDTANGLPIDLNSFRGTETTNLDKDNAFDPTKRFTNKLSIAVQRFPGAN